MNVVAIEPRTHNVIISRAYDTSKSMNESKAMYRDLSKLKSGTIIMVAIKEDGARDLHDKSKQFFVSQGSKEI